MAEVLSIRERIERQAVRAAEGISGVGTVRRWDGRGGSNAANTDVFIIAGDEDADLGPSGNAGFTLKTLSLTVLAVLRHTDEADSTTGAQIANRWLYRIEKAVMANPTMLESIAPAERLAVDTKVIEVLRPPLDEGQVEFVAAVRFGVEYEQNRDDPAVGPGITELSA